ncbi:MAG TPA: hypothetical protein VMI56_27310 [Reyranella sp.]|nr:hypothetical protein [Reyranella sp.]
MTDPQPGQLPAPKPPLIQGGDFFANIPQLVYILYLAGFFLYPAALVGLVLAYVNRAGADALARSHYDFQISTFWRGFALIVVGFILAFVFIGWLVLLFWLIWAIVRSINGLSKLSRGQPASGPTWGFG